MKRRKGMNVRILREVLVCDYNCWIEFIDEDRKQLYKKHVIDFVEESSNQYDNREIVDVGVWVDCEEENPDIEKVYKSICIRVWIGNDIQTNCEKETVGDMEGIFESCSYADMDYELLVAIRSGEPFGKGELRNKYNKYLASLVCSIYFRIPSEFMIEQYIEENGDVYEMGSDSDIFEFEISPYPIWLTMPEYCDKLIWERKDGED